jgi:MOB kinase activator 1
VSKIFTRLFRVYGHVYLCHVSDMERAGAMSHLNSCFKHFIFFALEFDLIEARELGPLQLLIRTIVNEDCRRGSAPTAAGGGEAASSGK